MPVSPREEALLRPDVAAVAVDDQEAAKALAVQRVERLGQHRSERLEP